MKRRGTRSDKQEFSYPHVADKIRWNGTGWTRYGCLYLVQCSICETHLLRSAGELNRGRRNDWPIRCKSCRKFKPEITTSCPICSTIFQAHGHAKNSTRRFCNKDCYAIWQQSDENRGENNPRWKGGSESCDCSRAEYNDWRVAIYERDNYTCQQCMVRGGQIRAHHIKPVRLFPDLELDLDNGVTLCEACHRGVHKHVQDEYPVLIHQ